MNRVRVKLILSNKTLNLMINPLVFCDFEGAKWIFFNPSVNPIIYYTHLSSLLVSLFLGLFVFLKNKKSLSNKILFYTILAFDIWVLGSLAFWATNRGDVVMFAWLIDILVEPLVYIGAFYLLYTFINKKDLSFTKKLFLGILYLPIPIFLASKLMLSGFEVSSCLAMEGPIARYYTYFLEIFISLLIIAFGIKHIITEKISEKRKEIFFLSSGMIFLLLMFAWGNIVGSFTEDWLLGQFGLFGMPIFLSFLIYDIVKFRTFNVKIASAQVFVWVLMLLVGLQFCYLNEAPIQVRILNVITLIALGILGLFLVRSVKKEIKLREYLQVSNEGQRNLIRTINHQIRGYLNSNQMVFSELLKNHFGKMPKEAEKLINEGLDKAEEGTEYVNHIMRGANAETGTLKYDMDIIDFKTLVSYISDEEKKKAEEKGLDYHVNIVGGEYKIVGDATLLGQAVKNIINNAIVYTIKGGIEISLYQMGDKIMFRVKDTGIGIKDEDKTGLFKVGGVGKDSLKMNVKSSGYGLVFVKNVVEKHKGKVWFESEGSNKGATFYIELPLA